MIRRRSAPGYDRIAHLYDVDMGCNMRFDDVGFYARICADAGGTVLELGCGNGRILLELVARGADAYGVDASLQMLAVLQAKARARALAARVCRMDVRALGFGRAFDVVICPYSLITYMRDPEDLAAMLGEARRVLRPRGVFVVDAFIPDGTAPAPDYRPDYARAFDAGSLGRSKRIERLAEGVNRIERRYEVRGADGTLEACIETVDEIREYSPEAVLSSLCLEGFRAETSWWDYASATPVRGAQFFTVVARARD